MSTPVTLSQVPILRFEDNAGNALVGGMLTTQVGGLNYPAYSDPAGAFALPNPIILNSRGEVATAAGTSSPLYLSPNVAYTLILQDALGNTIWTAPGIVSNALTLASLTAILSTSPILNLQQTAAEVAASVTPLNYAYPPGNVNRYDNNLSPGITDMSAAIQAALDQAAQPGGAHVFIPAGTYLVTTQLSIGSNVIFQGEGPTSQINFSSTANADNIVGNSINNAQILDMKLSVTGVMSSGVNYVGVIAWRLCNGCKVRGVEISGAYFAGVYHQASNSCQTIECNFHDFVGTFDGSDIHFQQTATGSCAYNLVARNQCNGGLTQGIAFETSATGLLNMWKNTVEANFVGTHTAYGILLYSHSGADTYNKVIGNHVENISGTNPAQSGSAGAGIYLAGMSAVTVANNTVLNCCTATTNATLAPGGIGLILPSSGSACTVTGNAIFDMAQGNANVVAGGIYAAAPLGGSNVPLNITGNTVSQSVNGGLASGIILYSGVSNSVVSGNFVNILNSIASTRGIFIYSNGVTTQNTTISGNSVQGCSSRGIAFEQNGGFSAQGFTVTGNIVSNGASTSVPIYVTNASLGSVAGNSCNANTTNALVLSTVSTTTVSGNTLQNSGGTPVSLAGVCTGSLFDESNIVSGFITNGATGLNVRTRGTAAPVGIAAAALGDVVYNTAGVTPFAWLCTAAGTPGTWTGLTIP